MSNCCPICLSNNTGKTGSNTYYCAGCLMEFTCSKGEMQFFYVDAEGTSVALCDLDTAHRLAEYIQQNDELLSADEIERFLAAGN